MPDFEWTKAKEEAAELVARGELGVGEIADRLGVTVRTLYEWRKSPEFGERVESFVEGFRAVLRSRAIGAVERRVDRLNRDWLKLQRVIEERAAAPEMKNVPGGDTGLLAHNIKAVGKGDDFQLIDVYEVDTGLLAELRQVEKQAAIELKQWTEKVEQKVEGGPITVNVVEVVKPANADADDATDRPDGSDA